MKICQIIYTYPPYATGGADMYAKKISEELSKDGHDVVVITTRPYDGLSSLKSSSEIVDGIKVYRFYPLNIYSWINSANKSILEKVVWNTLDFWNLGTYFSIKNILKKEKPDVVHIHTPIWISLSAFDAIKSLKIPFVFTVHDYLLLCRRTLLLHADGSICNEPKTVCKWYQKLSRKLAGNKPNKVIAPSQFIIDMLKTQGFFPETEFIKLSLGTELNSNKPVKNYETIDILFAGTLINHKGVDVLIQAFKNLDHPNIRLHILGKGNDENLLKSMAKQDNRIIFHGFKQGKELNNCYQQANITVVPSVCFDNSPLVIYESFMNGTPVIGSKIGGIPELINEGINGFLFNPGDPDDLKQIIEKLIESKDLLKRLEEGAFQSRTKYDMDQHIKNLEKIYNMIESQKQEKSNK